MPITNLIDIVIQQLKKQPKQTLWISDNAELKNIQVFVHEKGELGIISDGKYYMEVLFKKHDDQISYSKPSPKNNTRTPYYNYCKKREKYFDFSDDSLAQIYHKQNLQLRKNSPYYPQFHIDVRMQQYLKERMRWKQKSSYKEYIKINKWQIQLVNIANTCYYAPIMLVYQYSELKIQVQLEQSPTNIIYNDLLHKLLQNRWLGDQRKQQQIQQQQQKVSMFYYMSKIRFLNRVQSFSSFIKADKDQKFIKYSKNYAQFIPIGNLSGIQRFLRPFSYKISNKNKINLTPQAITYLQSNNPRQFNKSISHHSQEQITLSDSQHTDYNSIQNQPEAIDCQLYDSSDEDEEPLRKIYHKQLSTMKII